MKAIEWKKSSCYIKWLLPVSHNKQCYSHSGNLKPADCAMSWSLPIAVTPSK